MMSKKNETTILILALMATMGFVGIIYLLLGQMIGIKPANVSQNKVTDRTTTEVIQNFAQTQDVPNGLFRYGGSTTWAPIRGEVDQQIATVFPQFKLVYTDPISGAPGSSTGIKMLLSNQLAFSQSSRPLKPEEFELAQTRGFKLKEIPIAIDGIAIATHPDLNIPGLTIKQLKDIYTGKITNWKEVGGANVAITAYSRRLSDGGTVEFFHENVLGKDDFGSNTQFIPTTTEALRAVANKPGAIYYASAPEVIGQCTVKPLPIGKKADQLVAPYQEPFVPLSQCPQQRNQINAEVFQNGNYPITRNLFVIVKENGQTDQIAGETYAKLLLTNQGQELIAETGFVRIR